MGSSVTDTANRSGGSVRPFTGDEYLGSLRDGREVWIYGERVSDVTCHPAFRNTARTVARLYDALHDPSTNPDLTCPTDTGSEGFTHRFFRVARDPADLVASRHAIATWSRMTYGWLGRSPDFKAAFVVTLGANASYYSPYTENATRWYKHLQEGVHYLNHAMADPPVDRQQSTTPNDIQMRVERETDAGLVVSGAKTVATNSALTHYTVVAQIRPVQYKEQALTFILPMDAEGAKLLCRPSYQMAAQLVGSPFDYPLTSQYDENDSVLICDNVLVPWENVLIYGDMLKPSTFLPRSGFHANAALHGCTRLAVKVDFLSGLLLKSLEMTGAIQSRSVQIKVGEVLSWRSLFWSLTEAMVRAPTPWQQDALMPNREAGLAYYALAPNVYSSIRTVFEDLVASGLIYYNSHVTDLKTPELRPYIERYMRGTQGQDATERVKLAKLAWDAIGTEFGSRHELYERNYSGNHEAIQLNNYVNAAASGQVDSLKSFVEQCMSEYDVDGWKSPDLVSKPDKGDLDSWYSWLL